MGKGLTHSLFPISGKTESTGSPNLFSRLFSIATANLNQKPACFATL